MSAFLENLDNASVGKRHVMHSLERRREIEQIGWGEFSYNILEKRQANRFIDREPLGDLCELLEAELCVVYEGIDIGAIQPISPTEHSDWGIEVM